ncbi:hypothetical protein E2562_025297 [Oryza meyeriana var. granulata]|uniref:Uncharacterized protein n=1 Tax=Oryza meyeriana var. granulata TaxID=110450 RepID=A0A6G1EPB9_9ORYZ|nr:hypothetical protein E2562_025297 [Oryza meyeriana var. granulata]
MFEMNRGVTARAKAKAKASKGQIPSIKDRNQWPQVEKGFKLHPPNAEKKGVGWYRKNRFKSCLEHPKTTRKAGIKRQVKCSKCGREQPNLSPKREGQGRTMMYKHQAKLGSARAQPANSLGPVTRRMSTMAQAGEGSLQPITGRECML